MENIKLKINKKAKKLVDLFSVNGVNFLADYNLTSIGYDKAEEFINMMAFNYPDGTTYEDTCKVVCEKYKDPELRGRVAVGLGFLLYKRMSSFRSLALTVLLEAFDEDIHTPSDFANWYYLKELTEGQPLPIIEVSTIMLSAATVLITQESTKVVTKKDLLDDLKDILGPEKN